MRQIWIICRTYTNMINVKAVSSNLLMCMIIMPIVGSLNATPLNVLLSRKLDYKERVEEICIVPVSNLNSTKFWNGIGVPRLAIDKAVEISCKHLGGEKGWELGSVCLRRPIEDGGKWFFYDIEFWNGDKYDDVIVLMDGSILPYLKKQIK